MYVINCTLWIYQSINLYIYMLHTCFATLIRTTSLFLLLFFSIMVESTSREIVAQHRRYSQSTQYETSRTYCMRTHIVYVCLLLFIIIVISVTAETWSKKCWARAKNHWGKTAAWLRNIYLQHYSVCYVTLILTDFQLIHFHFHASFIVVSYRFRNIEFVMRLS
jgi:hypothetical protein